MKSYAQLLALPGQRRLLCASLPADFADWLDYVAIVALVAYSWHEGPWALALLALAFTLPHVLIGPWLAASIDRADLRSSLLLSNAGRAIATAALMLVPGVPTLLIVVFMRGVADTAFTPARQAAIQRLTPPELLGAANGLHQAVNQTSKIVGPALGGALLAVLPPQAIFGVNAALSVIAVLILLGLSMPPAPSKPRADEPSFERFTAGFSEFLANRKLLAVLIFAATAYFAFFLYDTLIALLALEFGYDATAFGLTITASGLGGLLGSIAAGSLASARPLLLMSGAALLNGVIAIGLPVLSLYATIPFPAFCIAMALMGGCTAFMLVPYRTVIQAETAPTKLARVFSAGEAVTVAVMMGAPFVGSPIAGFFGTGAAFIAGGILLLALGLSTLGAARRN